MSLTAEEAGILRKRERLLRYWPVVAFANERCYLRILPDHRPAEADG